MKLYTLLIISFCFSLVSCTKETTPPVEEVEPTVVATGMLDGESWTAYQTSQNISDGYLNFSLKQKKNQIGCPHHELSFRYIPLNEGVYLLKSSYEQEPEESTVFTNFSYTCGDAILGAYKMVEAPDMYVTISAVSENSLKGNFSTTFILEFPVLDVPQQFEFVDVDFEIEL